MLDRTGPTVPLIGLAHGSRHPDAAASLDRLLASVSDAAGQLGRRVVTRPAFLDLLDPDLPAAAAALADAGFERAVAVPLLFTSAFHATVDVPQTVREAVSATGLRLEIAPILGTGDDVVDVLGRLLDDASVLDGVDLVLYAVGSSDEAANEAVRDLADRLGRHRGVRARAAFGTRPPRGPELLDSLVADRHRRVEPVVVPLFTAPGLLLDPMIAAARRHGVLVTDPLEGRLAGLVLDRYRTALA